MSIRRFFALRKWERCSHIWPIDPSAAQVPANWKGWPKGKKFAFVITHDVEGSLGLSNVRALAKIEEEMGFRSSFNFIPEGEYRVTPETRDSLTADGFEVGVHDLNHDGKLFHTHAGFKAKAKRINDYVKEWGAHGYRSGFMFRNLEWMHDLNVNYDASTFDTDPFEPQPDGAQTIFPFFVEKRPERVEGQNSTQNNTQHPSTITSVSTTHPSKPGYVELPYTLAQDSTLFLLLQQKDINIWKQKIDWIVEHGGMVLVNVHPDYICFDDKTHNDSLFPVSFYKELLSYIKEKYDLECWHALPHQVANHFRRTLIK